jgi:hypothetical protein
MATTEQARRIFLAQPQAEEKSHMGHPDFRVGGKIFATLQPARKIAVVMLPPADLWRRGSSSARSSVVAS